MRRRSWVFAALAFALLFGGLATPRPALAQPDPGEHVYAFGEAILFGSTRDVSLAAPLVNLAPTPNAGGYWLLGRDGGVFSYGNAPFFGSTGNLQLNQPVVGMAQTPSGDGYWFVAADGGAFSFGDAGFFGSTGNLRLNQPVVGMAPTASGNGYWFVAADGGVFSFGDASFFGSMGGTRLNRPIVGMASTPTGRGYWLVASDGGIFSFGDAAYFGSTGGVALRDPVVGMAPASGGGGYWLAAADGGVFTFGSAPFLGSMGATSLGGKRVVGIAATPSGGGYWMVSNGVVPPAPPPSGTGVLAIGDSVMLGARPALLGAIPGIRVDASVGRQFHQAPGVLAAYRDRGQLGSAIVVHLGTNGTVSGGDLDAIMQIAAGRRVVFVNVRVPRSWEGQSNAAIAAGVSRWPNAVLADWRAVSSQAGTLASDGFHITGAGANAYAAMVRGALG